MSVLMSDSVDKIIPALVKAQSEFSTVAKDANNPFFKSRYATLQNVVDSTRPTLIDNGLAVTQWPTSGERGEIGVVTMVIHNSGQWMQHPYTVPVNEVKNMAQEAGKVITYFRRYGYAAALGIVIDEDADGNMPDQRNGSKPVKKNQPTKHPLLPEQLKKLNTIGRKLYADDWDAKREELVSHITNGGSKSSKELSYEQAGKLIDGIKSKLDAQDAEQVNAQFVETQQANLLKLGDAANPGAFE